MIADFTALQAALWMMLSASTPDEVKEAVPETVDPSRAEPEARALDSVSTNSGVTAAIRDRGRAAGCGDRGDLVVAGRDLDGIDVCEPLIAPSL